MYSPPKPHPELVTELSQHEFKTTLKKTDFAVVAFYREEYVDSKIAIFLLAPFFIFLPIFLPIFHTRIVFFLGKKKIFFFKKKKFFLEKKFFFGKKKIFFRKKKKFNFSSQLSIVCPAFGGVRDSRGQFDGHSSGPLFQDQPGDCSRNCTRIWALWCPGSQNISQRKNFRFQIGTQISVE